MVTDMNSSDNDNISSVNAKLERIELKLNFLSAEVQILKENQERERKLLEIIYKNIKRYHLDEENQNTNEDDIILKETKKSKKRKHEELIGEEKIETKESENRNKSDTQDSDKIENNEEENDEKSTKRVEKKKHKLDVITNEGKSDTQDSDKIVNNKEENDEKSAKRLKKKKHKLDDSKNEDKTETNKDEATKEPKNKNNSLELDLQERLESIKERVKSITEQKYEIKNKKPINEVRTRFFNHSKQNFSRNDWRKRKWQVKDAITSGNLRIDFKGANISKIQGYGEVSHK